MASLSAVIEVQGWSLDVIVLAFTGVLLTFGLWWIYFLVPAGDLLHAHRERAFFWGYSHVFVFAAIAAVGAGLHVAAYAFLGEVDGHHIGLSHTAVVACAAIPVALYFVSMGVILRGMAGPLVGSLRGTFAPLIAVVVPMVLAAQGVALTWCFLALSVAPILGALAGEGRFSAASGSD